MPVRPVVRTAALVVLIARELAAAAARRAAHRGAVTFAVVVGVFRRPAEVELARRRDVERDRRLAQRVQRRELARLLAELDATPRVSMPDDLLARLSEVA